MTTNTQTLHNRSDNGALDFYAASVAILCLLHCIALPLLISSVSLAIPFVGEEAVHKLLVLVAAPATVYLLVADRGRRGGRLFMAFAAIGLTLLFAGAFVHVNPAFERVTTVTGALLLATAHVRRAIRVRGAASARQVGERGAETRTP